MAVHQKTKTFFFILTTGDEAEPNKSDYWIHGCGVLYLSLCAERGDVMLVDQPLCLYTHSRVHVSCMLQQILVTVRRDN